MTHSIRLLRPVPNPIATPRGRRRLIQSDPTPTAPASGWGFGCSCGITDYGYAESWLALEVARYHGGKP